jgi:uncharacterized membrane protein (UPF0182 family)
MEDTLELALNRIFRPGSGSKPVPGLTIPTPSGVTEPESEIGPAPPPAPPTSGTAAPAAAIPENATLVQLAAEARATYDRAIAAQREGDWSRYGEEIKRLGDILERMAKQEQEKQP